MGKVKTHSATKKRVKVTGSGRFKHKRNGMRHQLRNKSKKAKRHLNIDGVLQPCNDGKVRDALNMGNPKPRRSSKPQPVAITEA